MTKQTWSLTREEMNDIALYALNAGEKTRAAVLVQNGDLDKAVKAMCSLAQEAADYMIRRKSTGADLYEYLPNADPDDDNVRTGWKTLQIQGSSESANQYKGDATIKSCYNCTFGEYHTEMRGGTPDGGAPEPPWFRCQLAGHGTFDAFYVDQGVADGFNCEDWTPDPPLTDGPLF